MSSIIQVSNRDQGYARLGPDNDNYIRGIAGAMEQPSQHLRHPGPADTKVASERRPALELAGVHQRLVVAGQLQGIAFFLRCGFGLRNGVAGTVPGRHRDDGRSM
jgi:hypothetical protein